MDHQYVFSYLANKKRFPEKHTALKQINCEKITNNRKLFKKKEGETKKIIE